MGKLFTGKCPWSLQYAVNVCIKLHLRGVIGKVLTQELKLEKIRAANNLRTYV
jgi:hypothetical protein